MNGRVETFVFFDLETTGLINWDAGQGKPMCPDIIEISMVAVHRDCLLRECGSSDMPRVLYKLTLPVRTNRVVNSCVASLTGLSNDDLLDAPFLSPTVVKAVAAFLECLATPLCLVAHNGDRFDFPIFLHHFGCETAMQSLMEHLYCADSLRLFKELDASGLTEPHVFDHTYNVSLSSQFTIDGSEMQSRNEHTPSRSRKGVRDAAACAPVQVSHIRSVGKPSAQQRLFDDDGSTMRQNAASSMTTNLATDISEPALYCSQEDTFSQASAAVDATWPATCRSPSQSSSNGKSRSSNRLSYGLPNVHARLFGQQPRASHGAEVDAETMLKCARFYGGRFVRLCEQTAVLLQFASRLHSKKSC